MLIFNIYGLYCQVGLLYRYYLADIGHSSHSLLAYLIAVYHDFKNTDIGAVLREVFDEQNSLSLTASVERRYRIDADGMPVPYDWHILTVTLTAQSFVEIIEAHLNAEQKQLYDLIMQSGGNRQVVASPLAFDWHPLVSCNYGYRVHPFSGVKDNHKGIDIAVPAGTEILATHNGAVTYAGEAGDYGLVIVLDDGKGLVTKYAHCDELLISTGQSVAVGEVMAKSGNTGLSTGAHLHLEIIKGGTYLNPLLFAATALREEIS